MQKNFLLNSNLKSKNPFLKNRENKNRKKIQVFKTQNYRLKI